MFFRIAPALLLASIVGTAHADLPITEVTIFKDGHAMVLRQGASHVNDRGNITLDQLPQPILGTFWAFENQNNARLASVTAGRISETKQVEPSTLHDLIRLATGTDLAFTLNDDSVVRGRLIKVAGSVAIIRAERTDAINLADIRRVEFADASVIERTSEHTTERDQLTFNLDWTGSPADQADIGLMYIQQGLRWIPSYRVILLDDDTARIELSATIVNELADLDNVHANLVVGVPSFLFDHTIDPMALQQQVAQLGQYFGRAAGSGAALSNAIMAQSARMSEVRGGREDISQPPTTVEGSTPNEDLYIFNLSNVSLKKGERLFVPIASAEVSFAPVYTLELPIAPPAEVWSNFHYEQQRQIAQGLDRPTAKHVLRITNSTEHPFTTAPALIIRDGQPLAQGLLRYTAKSATVDLDVTSAVDIRVEASERETDRIPNGLRWRNTDYARIDMQGSASITNYKTVPVTLEIRATALGTATNANLDADITKLNFFTGINWDEPTLQWSRWYGWPWWWSRFNPASRIEWNIQLKPGESTSLEWAWHYFWG